MTQHYCTTAVTHSSISRGLSVPLLEEQRYSRLFSLPFRPLYSSLHSAPDRQRGGGRGGALRRHPTCPKSHACSDRPACRLCLGVDRRLTGLPLKLRKCVSGAAAAAPTPVLTCLTGFLVVTQFTQHRVRTKVRATLSQYSHRIKATPKCCRTSVECSGAT